MDNTERLSETQVYSLLHKVDRASTKQMGSASTIGENLVASAQRSHELDFLPVQQRADVLFWLAENSLKRGKELLKMKSSLKAATLETIRAQIYLLQQGSNFAVNEIGAQAAVRAALDRIVANMYAIDFTKLPTNKDQLQIWVSQFLITATNPNAFQAAYELCSTVRDEAVEYMRNFIAQGWDEEEARYRVNREVLQPSIESLTDANELKQRKPVS